MEQSMEASNVLRVKRLSERAHLPLRATAGAAGYDLCSAEDCVIPARGKALVSTQLIVAIPENHYGRVAPRSSLAWKNFIDVGAGVIDCDYRGELKVVLYNHAETYFEVKAGERIAQLIIEKISLPTVVEVDDIEATVRGAGGFGSTNKPSSN